MCKSTIDKICKNEKLNIMINFDDVTKENKQQHNLNWPRIPDHPYRIPKVRVPGSGKTNKLLNMINHQPNID